MDRAQTIFKHWRYEQDAQGLVWLTFDRQGESANTFSREALNELSLMLEDNRWLIEQLNTYIKGGRGR